MKNIHDVIQKVEATIGYNRELVFVNDNDAVHVKRLDENTTYYLARNSFDVRTKGHMNKKPYDLRVTIDTAVFPLRGKVNLEQVDIAIIRKISDGFFPVIAQETFSEHEGQNLNPTAEKIMSYYDIGFLAEQGIELRKDFRFNIGEARFSSARLVEQYQKEAKTLADNGIKIYPASRSICVRAIPSQNFFTADERADRILNVYNKLVNYQ